MRVLCAPDSFKGSMTAAVAAERMALGIHDADPTAEVDLCPVSDGGEGFRATLAAALGGTTTFHEVTGPLGSAVRAGITLVDEPTRTVIEMAEAAGLEIVPVDRRDPERTTTRGVGEMIRIALDGGARSILLGLGGSATVDGGIGLAQALGYRFLDRDDDDLPAPLTGGMLSRIARIDASAIDTRLRTCDVRVACDVFGPLVGPMGAAGAYGPQKGATREQVARLESGLGHLADLLRRDLGSDVADLPGAGAAGGLGAGAAAFLGARIEPGVETVLAATGFDERLAHADLCLTGEGRIDGQTLAGKAVLGVARAARARTVPVIALVGRAGPGSRPLVGPVLDGIREIGEGRPLAEAMALGPQLIRWAARRLIEEG